METLNVFSLNDEDLRTVIKSIDQGALRVSGNMLVNSEDLRLNNSFLSLNLVKITREKLKQDQSIRSELDLAWKNDFVEVFVPYVEQL